MQSATTIWAWEDWQLPLTIGLLGAFLAASLFFTPLPFVLLLGVPLCFYYFSRPYELLLLMAFLIPFNFVFKIGPVPMAVELLKVFAWIPMLVHLRATGKSLRTSRYNWWFAIVGGLLLISVLRSNTLPFTIKECLRFLSNIGLCYLVLNLVDSREKVLQILRVLTYSTFLVACYGFYQFAIQDYGGLFWLIVVQHQNFVHRGLRVFGRALTTTPVFGPSVVPPRLSFSLMLIKSIRRPAP